MSKEPSRVAILSRVLTNYRVPVCDALADAGYGVHFVLAGDPGDEVQSSIPSSPRGWQWHDLRTSRRRWRGEVVQCLASVAPETILMEHGAALDFSWTVLLSRRLARVPKVLWTHGVERHERMGRGGRAGRLGRALQLRLADAIVTYDRHGAEAVREQLPGKPVFVAPNSTDGSGIMARRDVLKREGAVAHRRRLGLEHQSYLFALGRLIAEKRFEQVITIVARLKSMGVSVGAIIVGDGPDHGGLQAATRAAGLSMGHDIVFAGRVENPAELADWMYAADLAILPGYVGLAAIDSMFGGLPLVSAVPGVDGPFHAPEWFAAQESGLGIGIEGDDPTIWAEAIAGYLSRPEVDRQQHSEACATYAREHFGIEPLVAGLQQALDWARESRRPAGTGERRLHGVQ